MKCTKTSLELLVSGVKKIKLVNSAFIFKMATLITSMLSMEPVTGLVEKIIVRSQKVPFLGFILEIFLACGTVQNIGQKKIASWTALGQKNTVLTILHTVDHGTSQKWQIAMT